MAAGYVGRIVLTVYRLTASPTGCAFLTPDFRCVPRRTQRNDPKRWTRTPMALRLNELRYRVLKNLALQY